MKISHQENYLQIPNFRREKFTPRELALPCKLGNYKRDMNRERIYTCNADADLINIQGVFFTGKPPKKLKYGKPRLGESTLT